ncbi:NADH-ubiquinone oxidoreductase-F iron-sulfur binding region domain-containing protein, partial [Sutterella wadsworthensis]
MQAAFSYGHWQGRRLDNRSAVDSCDLPVGFPLEEAAAFNQGNPLTSVIGPQGFLVFENAPHLTVILYAYYEDARSFSCGRCTPCRMGTVLIAEALKNAVEGRGSTVDWDEIAETARHMKVSSLCGIGLQSAEPILGAIENFRAELETTEPVAGLQGLKDAKQYVSTATAPCIEACPAHVNVP